MEHGIGADSAQVPHQYLTCGNALFHSALVFRRQSSVRDELPNFTKCVAVREGLLADR